LTGANWGEKDPGKIRETPTTSNHGTKSREGKDRGSAHFQEKGQGPGSCEFRGGRLKFLRKEEKNSRETRRTHPGWRNVYLVSEQGVRKGHKKKNRFKLQRETPEVEGVCGKV